MGDNIARVKVLIKADGSAALEKQSLNTANNYTRATKAANSIKPGGAAINSSYATPAYQKSIPETANTVTDKGYGVTRAAVGTGAAGRDFSKQAQGLGGLVGLYATFAANIFAVGAAFQALNKAAQVERLTKAVEVMSISTGNNLGAISKNLVEASGYALSFAEAMQFTNIGTSAGLAAKQIEGLTKIAKGAANALGRDVGDSVRRIIQGTAKQEQEILDELGIFIKASQAYSKFAAEMNIKVADMTGAQRTQAYANEVERLGQKWTEFAEIPDPFSKFTATGKNALNDLLVGINNVFTPLLNFLSQSEGAIKALIVLISSGLAKRALPEIGGILNNLFTFDKARIAKEAAEAQQQIINAYVDATAKLTALKKAREALSIPTLEAGSFKEIVGNSAYKSTKNSGISLTKLSQAFIGTEKDPLNNLSTYTSIELVNKKIEESLLNQLKDSKVQDRLLQSLIDKKIIAENSTLAEVTLNKEGLRISQALFGTINEINAASAKGLAIDEQTAVAASTQLAAKKAMATLPKGVAKEGLASATSTVITSSPIIANTDAVTTNSQAKAKNAVQTEAMVLASNSSTISSEKSTLATSTSTKALATNLTMRQAYNKGLATSSTFEGLLTANSINLSGKLKIIGAELAMAATTSVAFGGGVGFAAGAAEMLGLALKTVSLSLKGIIAVASAALMPLMLVWTGWEMFGDTIKKWIGIDTEAEKRLEESIAKQKEYAETVGLAALSLKQVNEARLTGIGSIEEKIHYDTVELNAFKGHVEAYEKLVEEKKVAREKETLDSLKKDSKPGAVFSEEVFHLKQMAESERLTEKQKIRTLELADAVQKAENALSMAYGPGRVVAQTNLNNVLAITSLHTKDIYKNAEQNSAQNGKFQSSIELVTKAFEEQFKANTKLGDPSLGLNTEKAKNTYEGLATVLDSSMGATIKYEGVQRLLAKGIAAGGKTAAIATGMYKALAETQATASMFLLEGRISPEEFARRMESAFQDAKKGLLDLAFSMNDVKAPKAIKPYSDESKRQFKALQDDIDLITIKMKQLATEEKKDSALQARLKAINGIVSAEALANEKVYRDKQAQFTLDKEMGDAKLALEKVLQNKTNKGAEGKQAIEAAKAVYISKLQVLGLTKIELDTLSEIKFGTDLINKATADRNVILKNQADLLAIDNGYTQQKLDTQIAELNYAKELGYMTGQEIVNAEYLLEVERQKQALKNSQSSLVSKYESDIAQPTSVLTTEGSTEEDKAAAVAKILELNALYQLQNALILSGAEGLAAQTAKAQELKVVLASNNDTMKYMVSITESLSAVFGDLGTNIGKTGEALLKMAHDDTNYLKNKAKLEKELESISDDDKYTEKYNEIKNLDKKALKDQLSNIGTLAGASKKMFAEKTTAYKVINAVEKASYAFKLALQIKDMAMDSAAFLKKIFFVQAEVPIVAGATAAKTGIELAGQAATMPAKIAGTYASFMAMLGPFGPPAAALAIAAFIGSFAGGGSSSVNLSGLTSADKQETQGTGISWVNGQKVENGGGVFGDTEAKSTAIVDSLEILKNNSITGLKYDNKLLRAMEKVAAAVSDAATSIYQIPGLRIGSAFGTQEGTSGGTTFGWGTTRSTSIADSGIKLQGSFAQLTDATSKAAKIYETVITTKNSSSFFGLRKSSSSSTSTNIKNLEEEQAQAIADIFANATDMFIEIGKSAGIAKDTIINTLAHLPIDLETSTRGLTGKALEDELNSVVGNALSQGTKSIFSQFDKYKKFGEDYLTTTIRVVDGNDKVDQALRAMASTYDVTTDKIIDSTKVYSTAFFGLIGIVQKAFNTISKFDISEALIKLAGGLENFMTQAQFFRDNFLTAEQKLVGVQAATEKELTRLGLSADTTKEQLAAVVIGLDLTNPTTREFYQSIMDLAPGFEEMKSLVEEVKSKVDADVAEAESKAKETRNITIDLIRLQGKMTEALNMTRADELATLSDTDKLIQQQIYLEQDLAKVRSQETNILVAQNRSTEALNAKRSEELRNMEDLLKPGQEYLYALEDEAALKAKIVTAYNKENSAFKATINTLGTAIKTLTGYRTSLLTNDKSTLIPAAQYQELKSQVNYLSGIATSIAVTDSEIQAKNDAISKLPTVTGDFLTASKTLYASSEQYTQDFNSILGLLDTVGSSLLSQKTDAELQLEALDESVAFLNTISNTTETVSQLLAQYLPLMSATETARLAAVEGGSSAAATISIPAFASGGIAQGTVLVGERGPEVVNFSNPGRVYSNIASNDLLNTKELVAEIKALRNEVSQLRKEQNEQTGHLIATNYDANSKAANRIVTVTEEASNKTLWEKRSAVKVA